MGLFDKLFAKKEDTYSSQHTDISSYVPEKSFDDKLRNILQNIGDIELKKYISPSDLEEEMGTKIFTCGDKRCYPEKITYALYIGGKRVLFIRLWDEYQIYNHRANREIKEFCDSHQIAMLDFFDYMPNEESYIEDRIKSYIL